MRAFLPFLFVCAITSILFSTRLSAQIEKLYLSPKAASGANQSKFIDSIRFIPLETKGEPIKSWNNVIVTKNYFLILEYVTMNGVLYFFDKSGKFVKRMPLTKYGQRPSPSYDENRQELRIVAFNKNYTLIAKDILDIKEHYTSPANRKYYKAYVIDLKDPSLQIKPTDVIPYDILDVQKLHDDVVCQSNIITNKDYKDSLGYELNILRGNSVIKSFFPYNKKNEVRYKLGEQKVAVFPTDTSYIHYVARPYDYKVYKLNKDSLYPVYEVVVPIENGLPQSFYTKDFKNKTEEENYFQNNASCIKQIYRFVEMKRFLWFQFGYVYYKWEGYIYDKEEHKFYSADKIKGDSTQYNLQLIGANTNATLGGSNKFYTTKKASELLSFYNANKDKNIKYPAELASFFKTGTDNSNPIIVEFTFKK